MLTLNSWLSFLHYNVSLHPPLPPFFILYSLEGSHVQLTQGNGELCSASVSGDYYIDCLEFFWVGDIFIILHV